MPGKPLGLKLHWLDSETSIKLSDLPEDTQNRLKAGIPQTSVDDAQDTISKYRHQIDEEQTRQVIDAQTIRDNTDQGSTSESIPRKPPNSPPRPKPPKRIRKGVPLMSRRNTELLLLIASAFPVILLYAMYVLTAGAAISFETLAVPIGLFAAFAAAHIAVRILAPGADPAILPIVFVLSGIGITFVTRLAPALAISQLIILFVSVALMVGTLALVKNLDVVMRYKYTFGIIGIILLMLPIFIGTTISGSKLWIRIAGFTIQPGEFAKVFIVLFLAGYLAENRELLSISNRKILGFKIPRLRLLLPLFAVWGVCLLVVVFERDLGSAVLFYTIFLLMLYVATGRFSYVVIGLALLAVGAVGAYKFLSHVQVRFQVWVDPFKDAQGQGYQIVQSLFSLADGGLVGVGIGNGMANNIPVVESDFIFSAIGEEMGLLAAAPCSSCLCSLPCVASPRLPALNPISPPLAPRALRPPSASRPF